MRPPGRSPPPPPPSCLAFSGTCRGVGGWGSLADAADLSAPRAWAWPPRRLELARHSVKQAQHLNSPDARTRPTPWSHAVCVPAPLRCRLRRHVLWVQQRRIVGAAGMLGTASRGFVWPEASLQFHFAASGPDAWHVCMHGHGEGAAECILSQHCLPASSVSPARRQRCAPHAATLLIAPRRTYKYYLHLYYALTTSTFLLALVLRHGMPALFCYHGIQHGALSA